MSLMYSEGPRRFMVNLRGPGPLSRGWVTIALGFELFREPPDGPDDNARWVLNVSFFLIHLQLEYSNMREVEEAIT